MMKKYQIVFVVALSLLLAACSSPKRMFNALVPTGNYLAWSSVTLVAQEDANLNSALAVDVVMLHDEETLGLVQSLSAAKWFATRDDLLKTFPLGLSVQSVELVPGQTLPLHNAMFEQKRQVATLVFSNFLTPGEHRMRVDPLQGQLLVQLNHRDFTVTTANAP
jgi:type VI secretion system protein